MHRLDTRKKTERPTDKDKRTPGPDLERRVRGCVTKGHRQKKLRDRDNVI